MFKTELSGKIELINHILEKYTYTESYPEVIYESMTYSLFAGGKRIRPLLLLEACIMSGGCLSDCEPLLAAIEMIHTYSLIHDDLPCMDDDDLRRGKPTNHIVFGYPIAVLSGDGLLNCAYEIMINGYTVVKHKDKYMSAISVIANAAGVRGMIGGQVADIINENRNISVDTLEFIHRNKTGALISAALQAGAICGGADEDRIQDLLTYGQCIGLMFQINDDILDVKGDANKIGKKVNRDSELNKNTYYSLLGEKHAYLEAEILYNKAMDILDKFDGDADFLKELTKYLKERQN